MAKHLATERPFESIIICPSDAPQAKLDAFIEKLKETVTHSNGTVNSVQNWGRRRLTYPIRHQKEGQYIYMDFNGSNTSVQALNTLYKVSDLVLRHMTVDRPEAPPPPPAAAPKPAEPASAEATPAAATAQKEPPSTSKEA